MCCLTRIHLLDCETRSRVSQLLGGARTCNASYRPKLLRDRYPVCFLVQRICCDIVLYLFVVHHRETFTKQEIERQGLDIEARNHIFIALQGRSSKLNNVVG